MAVMTSTRKGPESRAEVSPDIAEPKLKLSAWKAEALITENKHWKRNRRCLKLKRVNGNFMINLNSSLGKVRNFLLY